MGREQAVVLLPWCVREPRASRGRQRTAVMAIAMVLLMVLLMVPVIMTGSKRAEVRMGVGHGRPEWRSERVGLLLAGSSLYDARGARGGVGRGAVARVAGTATEEVLVVVVVVTVVVVVVVAVVVCRLLLVFHLRLASVSDGTVQSGRGRWLVRDKRREARGERRWDGYIPSSWLVSHQTAKGCTTRSVWGKRTMFCCWKNRGAAGTLRGATTAFPARTRPRASRD